MATTYLRISSKYFFWRILRLGVTGVGKAGRLKGFQVAIDRAYPSFSPLRDLFYGQPVRAGLKSGKNLSDYAIG